MDAAPDADGDADADGGGDVREDDGADPDGGDGGAVLAVLVGRSDWSNMPPTDPVPIADAWVALDAPGGGRMEAQTESDGQAKFVGLDWAAGTATVTAYADGFTAAGRAGITVADGTIVLLLDELGPPAGMVEITGSVRGLDPVSCLYITTTALSSGVLCGGAADYSFYVTPGVPFTVVAFEQPGATAAEPRSFDWPISGWSVFDHPAVVGPETIDVDFAAAATPARVSGSFALPSSADSILAAFATGAVTVHSLRTLTLLGRSVLTTLSADELSVEYDLEYLEVAGVAEPVTEYDLYLNPGPGTQYVSSATRVAGYPTPGAHDPGFLEPPGVLTARPRLHESIAWELYDADVHPFLWVLRESDQRVLISIEGPVDATTLAVPASPAAVDETALLGTGALLGMVGDYRMDPSGRYWERHALTDPFPLAR